MDNGSHSLAEENVGSWMEDKKGLNEADDKEPCNHSIGEKLGIYGYWNILNTILINNIVNGFASVEGNGQRNTPPPPPDMTPSSVVHVVQSVFPFGSTVLP